MSLQVPHDVPAPRPRRRHLRPADDPSRDPDRDPRPDPTPQPRLRAARPPLSRGDDPVRPAPPPPPPEAAIQRLALLAFEIVEGHRPLAQLGGLVAPEVIESLRRHRLMRGEHRSLCRDLRRVVPVPGRPRIDRPLPGVIECAVVLRAEPRATAVALRFEVRRHRWQATHVTVL